MTTKPTLIALAVLSTAPAMAQLSDSAGISGEVSLSAGYTSSTSNFNTDTNATITDNTQKGQSDSSVLALPLGSIAYTFGSQLDQQFYAGTSREDIAIGTLALELGYKQQLANGTVIDASFLPTIMSGETWADPFLEGSARSVTDEKGNAYRLKFSNIANSGFSLDTAYAIKDIENEQSGQARSVSDQQLLRRDATSIYVKGNYRIPVDRTMFLVPSLTYIKTDADGDANSLTSWGGELSLFKVINRHQFALTASYTSKSYDASHPVYNKVRDDDELSLFAAYEYQQFMGWRDWSLISFAGYGQTDSNIEFYDEDQMIFSVGVNYQF
ncbi:DUF2860 domain-containing protein [Vibrio europaeus]|uniref:DUF2860 domain-containing protein n=1 Tax=Vibrio europaeus TaxID=300876 RepID=A0AAE7AZ58_9VIBR|nr:DUF2860 domain-containing protein [Vibrio europaeus]MDC5803289.1 DUF2860 domain-containing protein [Vibrio europaeus]MDC5808473.1 DUF2860 domain-containing protein [Vibrio europaeus]MDC5823164.1 DUF2860 domain-containing protein [Vibrio europaeus]MDC5828015.1 DUF2860 domain-containing protein [Vibrio europaeus]MDC5832895.1 DUF2860 domain-containing protein [Vibrio europaeus]